MEEKDKDKNKTEIKKENENVEMTVDRERTKKCIEVKGFDNCESESQNRSTAEGSTLKRDLSNKGSSVPKHQTTSGREIIGLQLPNKKMNEYLSEATSDNRDGLAEVLAVLNLTDKFPGGFTRSDMYNITKSSLYDEQPKSHRDLAKYFLDKIAKYSYKAREFHITEGKDQRSPSLQTASKSKFRQKMEQRVDVNKAMTVSPMDVIIAVFLCCDDICKQDLVSHMWSCRLSVPLIIQEKAIPCRPSCYLWPLRSLVMRWETEVNEEIHVRDGRLVKEPITSIAFIRFGEVGLSKSALINCLISSSEKTHSIFMHRDSPGSTRCRYLVNGLIDIAWYFPTPKTESSYQDSLQQAVLFLNLHGDAFELQNQVQLLSKLANTITVLCKVKDILRCRHILKSYLEDGVKLLVMLTDNQLSTEDDAVIDTSMDHLKGDENQLQFMEVGDKTKAELIRETLFLLRQLSDGKHVCLEKVIMSDVHVVVDEQSGDFLIAQEEACSVSNILRKTPYQDRKRLHLPLQGDPWIRWAIADKERLRIANKRRNETIHDYMAARCTVMDDCRSKQVEILRRDGQNSLLHLFFKSISVNNEKQRRLFLRWLKFELDDLSRAELCPVYKSYQQIMKRLATARDEEKVSLKPELDKIDHDVSLLSFGLEHLLREMGQLYEASIRLNISENPFGKYNLPELAAKIILDGYPFELLDGHVNSVPHLWVTNVLKSLQHTLTLKRRDNKIRTKVISTLGIQSSGKSTMLNVLFGCQYAVSAGRCTRGVYCQFIEVDEMYKMELGTDFVVVIDTEGLRAPELSAINDMIKHDNELSTFVIGLADITILNLMGENTTYLDELLPISVHAFLRMEMATSLKPKCVIVHQNVIKEDNQKLLQQCKLLEEKLNSMTELACKIEKTKVKSFKEVIEFDVSRDVFYLTALLEGIQPMAPISTRYSEELTLFKRELLTKGFGTLKSLDSFIEHLQTLWKAIKKDAFVYQFRNTIETEARTKLDDYWCDANWKFRKAVHELLSTGYVQMQNCKDTEDLDSIKMTLTWQIERKISEEYQNQKSAFEKFLEEADTIVKGTMTKWSVDMDKRFDDLREDLQRETSIKLTNFEQDKMREIDLKHEQISYKDKLKAEMEQFLSDVKSLKDKPLSEEGILKLFEQNWKKWKSQVVKKTFRPQAKINIENDAHNAILRAFPNGSDVLVTYLVKHPIEYYDISNFDVNEILSRTGRALKFIRVSNPEREGLDLAETLFEKVNRNLESRGRNIRPYTQEDIDMIVMLTQQYCQSKGKSTNLKSKYEVYLALIVCGYSIKKLKTFHEAYEMKCSPEMCLENDKIHYLRIFEALYDEAKTISLLAADCSEIIKSGILERMTSSLSGKILDDMRTVSLTMSSKVLAISDIMVETAENGNFEDFLLFIHRPETSISHYLSKRVDDHADQKDKPLEGTFKNTLNTISDKVRSALQKSFQDVTGDFESWLGSFQRCANDVIVLANIDRLKELAKGKIIDMMLYSEKVNAGLDRTVNEIRDGITSYLGSNRKLFRDQIVEEVMTTIIGCTESCPFCGAICIRAYDRHTGDHFSTLHRPQGCKRVHYKTSKLLVTDTCPVLVASTNLQFSYLKDEKKMYCNFKDYREVYPDWNITSDETGEETSFWNWFFKEYVEQIAGDKYKVPEIHSTWKLLDRVTEINKLKERM